MTNPTASKLRIKTSDLPDFGPFTDEYGNGACIDHITLDDDGMFHIQPDDGLDGWFKDGTLRPCPDCQAANVVGGWQFRSAYGLFVPEAVLWIIENLLAKGTGGLVSGLPRSMKSLIWLCAVIEAAAGKPVWNHFPVPRPLKTLFLETEDSQNLLDSRIQGFCCGLGISQPPSFHAVRIGPIDLVNCKDKIREVLGRFTPDLVVLSTLYNVIASVDMKSQSEMDGIHRAILGLSDEFKCSFVVLTHSPLDGSQRALGTVTTPANYATLMHLAKQKRTLSEAYLLDVAKSGTDEPKFYLELKTVGKKPKDVRRVIVVAAPKKAWSPQVQAIHDYVVQCAGRASRKQVGDKLKLDGDALRKALKRAEESEAVTSDGDDVVLLCPDKADIP